MKQINSDINCFTLQLQLVTYNKRTLSPFMQLCLLCSIHIFVIHVPYFMCILIPYGIVIELTIVKFCTISDNSRAIFVTCNIF